MGIKFKGFKRVKLNKRLNKRERKVMSKRTDEMIERICFSGAIALAISIFTVSVCSIVNHAVYSTIIGIATYMILILVMFMVLWVALLGKMSGDYRVSQYKEKLKEYRIRNRVYEDMVRQSDFDKADKDFENDIKEREKLTADTLIDNMNLSDTVKIKLKDKGITILHDLCKYTTEEIDGIVGIEGVREISNCLTPFI